VIVPLFQEAKAILKQISLNKKEKIVASENYNNGDSQPLQHNGKIPNGIQNQAYATTLGSNKHEFIFQRLRNTLSRVLNISKSSQ